MSSDLIYRIYDNVDRLEVIDELDRLMNSPGDEQSIKAIARSILIEAIIGRLTGNIDKRNITLICQQIRQELLNMIPFELEVAVPLTELTKERVGLWIKKNLGNTVVVHYKLNRSILGGCKITYNGKYGDFSLREKFDLYWKENKAKQLQYLGL